MSVNFKEKYGPWALITGATSGIGFEFVKEVARRGLNVVMVARRGDLLEEKKSEITTKVNTAVQVRCLVADLSQSSGVEAVIEGTRGVDIGLLIPCAGMEVHGPVVTNDISKELAMIQLNVTSVFALTHHYAKGMVERKKGGILLVASIAGHLPNPFLSNYAGTKAYIVNYGQSLNYELAKKNVDVTVLSPGPTKTPMLDQLATEVDVQSSGMSVLDADYVAACGLNSLGVKPVVIPGYMSSFQVSVATRLLPTWMQISQSGQMMERSMKKELTDY
eukprot:Nk52_evm1s2103 gene=Nk52_evmTU1s2103